MLPPVVASGRKQLMQMGQALKFLDASGKRIQSFQKLKTQVIAAKNSWQAAEAQVRELALEMKQTANPTAKMKSEFEKAKNAAGRAKTAYEKKQESLYRFFPQASPRRLNRDKHESRILNYYCEERLPEANTQKFKMNPTTSTTFTDRLLRQERRVAHGVQGRVSRRDQREVKQFREIERDGRVRRNDMISK